MPVHSIPRGYIHERIPKIQAGGERIVAVCEDGACVLVFTELTGKFVGAVETRA